MAVIERKSNNNDDRDGNRRIKIEAGVGGAYGE
jgi:hypothetical protein